VNSTQGSGFFAHVLIPSSPAMRQRRKSHPMPGGPWLRGDQCYQILKSGPRKGLRPRRLSGNRVDPGSRLCFPRGGRDEGEDRHGTDSGASARRCVEIALSAIAALPQSTLGRLQALAGAWICPSQRTTARPNASAAKKTLFAHRGGKVKQIIAKQPASAEAS